MKNRLLPLTLVVLTLGFAVIFLSAKLIDNNKSQSKDQDLPETYLNKLRNNQHTGALNPADVSKARNQVHTNQVYSSSRAFDFDWEVRGPNNMGGRTRSLVVDNTDGSGNTLYMGNVIGGIFKSVDGGLSWQKTNTENGNLNVSAMVQTDNGELFAGTGEGFTMQDYNVLGDWGYDGGFMGQGVFKSTDGENFILIQSTMPTDTEWAFINELAAKANTLIAATNTGLKFSSNAGDSWQIASTTDGVELNENSQEVVVGSDGAIIAEVNDLCYVSKTGSADGFVLRSGDSTIDLPTEEIGRMEFAIAPGDPNVFYALVVNLEGALVNVYRSGDKGDTWEVVGPGGSTSFNVFNTGTDVATGNGLYNCEIEVYPNNPDMILVGGLNMWVGIKYGDGYFDWEEKSEGNQTPPVLPIYLPNGHNKYVFKPGSSDSCYVVSNGGISLGIVGNPDFFVFQVINKDYISGNFYTVGLTNDDDVLVGGAQDLGTILIDGLTNPYEKKRGEDIWTTQAALPDGIHGGYCTYSAIYSSAVFYSKHPQPTGTPESFVRRNEYGGWTDWAADFFDSEYNSDGWLPPFVLWESFEMEDSFDSVLISPNTDIPANTTLWVESNNPREFKYTTESDIAAGDSVWINDPIASRFFMGGTNMVVMTREAIQFDVFPEWFVIADEDHSNLVGEVQSLAISSDANHLFAGTIDGKLFRISNLLYAVDNESGDVSSPYCVVSTTEVPLYIPNTTDPVSQVITSISFDPNDNNKVIVTLGNYGNEHYVYMTTNALDPVPDFVSIQGDPDNGGLPLMPAYSSLIEMDATNSLVIVGTEFGIYSCSNVEAANPVWTVHNNNIGKVPVMMLKQQLIRKNDDIKRLVNAGDTTYIITPGNNNYGIIYGATYGRGLISLDEFQQPVGINELISGTNKEATFSMYPNPVIDEVTISFELESSMDVEFIIYDMQGRAMKTFDNGVQNSGKHEIRISCEDLPNGTYVLQLISGHQSSSSKFIVY